MLRSEEVECVSLYLSKDNARSIVDRIGKSGIIQVFNENEITSKDKESDLDIVEQKLLYLQRNVDPTQDALDETSTAELSFPDAILEIDEYYSKLIDLKSSLKSISKEELMIEQNLKILKTRNTFTEMPQTENSAIIHFDFISAITCAEKKLLIKSLLKKRLRRNIYIKSTDVSLSSSSKKYTVLNTYVLGTANREYVSEIITTLGGRVYEHSKDVSQEIKTNEERHRMIKQLRKNIERQIKCLIASLSNRIRIIQNSVHKERTVRGVLSRLSETEGADCYTGKGWILSKDFEEAKKLQSFESEKGRFFIEKTKTLRDKPTHFTPSKFAACFQNLTNVFGIPKYREINPGVFMIFTFPFLFGAMFGDVLHGIILLFLSLAMILNFEKLNKNCGVFQIILNGRYVVFACSLAAIWFGFLYGDFGSLPISLFKSQFEVDRTYPFGIDPVWHHAHNKMVFINSLKMKLSLIIGFFHMGIGAIISIANSIYFRSEADLYFVALPQAISYFLFLGYVVFLCVYKWLVTVDHPSIVNTLIGMYTDPLNIKDKIYPGQMYVQLFIFCVLLISVPWMVLSKPFYLIMKNMVPPEGMLDLWIGSGIHAVEFFLGLISNTSSYLRLWAVSLAHVQLTSVLHEFTIGNSSVAVKILTFPIYLAGTFMLLIGLEGLSSCLHALRLNWIEFFSKFYKGGGEKFSPVSFVKPEEDED